MLPPRASELVQKQAPPPRSADSSTRGVPLSTRAVRRSTAPDHVYHTGPRGGCYTYRERLLPSDWTLGTPWTAAGIVEDVGELVLQPVLGLGLADPRAPELVGHEQQDQGAGGDQRSTGGTQDPRQHGR